MPLPLDDPFLSVNYLTPLDQFLNYSTELRAWADGPSGEKCWQLHVRRYCPMTKPLPQSACSICGTHREWRMWKPRLPGSGCG